MANESKRIYRADDPQRLITAEVIERLRARHVRLYERRLLGGNGRASGVVNMAETQALLDIWKGMAGKTWLLLTETEEREVVDALGDEDWELVRSADGEVLLAREPIGSIEGVEPA